MRYVARAQTDGDGAFEPVEDAKDDFIEQIGSSAGRGAFEHLAKDEAGNAIKLTCKEHLSQHAIDLIGLGSHIFDKQQLAFGLRCESRTQGEG